MINYYCVWKTILIGDSICQYLFTIVIWELLNLFKLLLNRRSKHFFFTYSAFRHQNNGYNYKTKTYTMLLSEQKKRNSFAILNDTFMK